MNHKCVPCWLLYLTKLVYKVNIHYTIKVHLTRSDSGQRVFELCTRLLESSTEPLWKPPHLAVLQFSAPFLLTFFFVGINVRSPSLWQPALHQWNEPNQVFATRHDDPAGQSKRWFGSTATRDVLYWTATTSYTPTLYLLAVTVKLGFGKIFGNLQAQAWVSLGWQWHMTTCRSCPERCLLMTFTVLTLLPFL